MLRQGSPRDERRRRALVEDARASDTEAPASLKPARTRAARNEETYSELARAKHQWRVTDFIPRRSWGLAVWLVAGIVMIALLEVGYWMATGWWIADAPLPRAIDLAARDSLAGYTSALVLIVSAAVSLLIYGIRRHRLDDYRGRYRVWAWAALLWCLASIDAVADLRTLVRVTCVQLTGYAGPGDGVAWWLAPWLLALLFVALRTALDIRPSRPAFASYLIGLACWTAALSLDSARLPMGGTQAAMLCRGFSLSGDWLLFWSCIAYCRYVLLEAHGELPLRRVKAKKESRKLPQQRDDLSGHQRTTAKPVQAASARIDSSHASPGTKAAAPSGGAGSLKWGANTPTPVARPSTITVTPSGIKPAASIPTVQSSPARTQFVDATQADSQPGRTLSRAERKRLRREQRARERGE